MKRKRFSVEQIVAVVKQAELGLPVADLIRCQRRFNSDPPSTEIAEVKLTH